MKYLSVCAGIEAASVAWHCLGWEPLALSEIEAFPRAVLAHHYPGVPLHGDFTKLRDDPWIVDADVLVGGTPCQAFSVAGLRRSLDDDRGNLSFEFVRLADAIDDFRLDAGKQPAIVVWENVPGVLSVKDNAFGCFLSALAGEDTAINPPGGKWTDAGVVDGPRRRIAWRILDAQYFGLAQRRRRVFVVASAREGFDSAAVLLEHEGVRRDTPPRRETGQVASVRAANRAGERSHWDGVNNPHPTLNQSHNTGGVGQSNQEIFSQRGAYLVGDVTAARMVAFGEYVDDGTASTLKQRDYKDATDLVAHTLKGEGFNGSEDGTGRGTPLVPVISGAVGFYQNQGTQGSGDNREISPTLKAADSNNLAAVAYRTTGNDGVYETGDIVHALTTATDPNSHVLAFSAKDHGADATEELAPTLRAGGADKSHANSGNWMAVAYPINTQIALRHNALGERTGMGIGGTEDPAFTLQAGHSHAVAYAFAQNSRDEVRLQGGDGQIVGALSAEPGMKQTTYVAVDAAPCVAVAGAICKDSFSGGPSGRPEGAAAGHFIPTPVAFGGDVARTLSARHDSSPCADRGMDVIASAMAVRRLTPVECERLQGFPDAYTLIPWRNKPAADCPDGPRYKALGNSMAVPVMRWIGNRIAQHLKEVE